MKQSESKIRIGIWIGTQTIHIGIAESRFMSVPNGSEEARAIFKKSHIITPPHGDVMGKCLFHQNLTGTDPCILKLTT